MRVENASCINTSQMTDEVSTAYTFYMDTVLAGSMAFTGIVLNVTAFAVLWTERTKSSSFFYLLALSVADTFYLIHCLLFQTFRSIYPYTGVWESYAEAWPYMEPYEYPFGMMALTASIWIVSSVAVDRYIVVRFPYKASAWCSLRRTKTQLLAMIIASVAFNSLWFFRQRTEEEWDACRGASVPVLVPYAIGESESGRRAHTIAFLTLVFAIPILIMIVMNALLLQALYRQRRLRQALVAHPNRSRPTGRPTYTEVGATAAKLTKPNPSDKISRDGDENDQKQCDADSESGQEKDGLWVTLADRQIDRNEVQTSEASPLLLRERVVSHHSSSGDSWATASQTSWQRKEHKITVMLIMIILQNLLCLTPVFIDHVLFTAVTIRDVSRAHQFFSVFANTLTTLHSSMNFFIYCCYVSSMRKRLLDGVRSCCRRFGKYQLLARGGGSIRGTPLGRYRRI